VTTTGAGNITVSSGNFTATGAVALNGTGTVRFSNSGGLISLPSTVAVNSGTLAINRTDDLTVGSATAIATSFAGAGTLQKEGTNTVEITGDNSALTGTMIVTGGTLATRSTTALANTIVQSGATLDMGSTTTGAAANGGGTKSVTISGAGVGGLGALSVTTAGPNANGNNAHVVI